MARKGINEVIPGKLYQRGKILTWLRQDKVELIDSLNIGIIVNFWPKVDAELSEMPLDWYLQISTPRSEHMTRPCVLRAADHVAQYLRESSRRVLVLCEAGKTRSTFFCGLVLLRSGRTPDETLQQLKAAIPAMELKDFMYDFIEKGGGL